MRARFKTVFWRAMPWLITIVCVLLTIHMVRQYNRVCTHIMNISDGMYESNATNDAKNRAYLGCYVLCQDLMKSIFIEQRNSSSFYGFPIAELHISK